MVAISRSKGLLSIECREGAPLNAIVLHRAVDAATVLAPKEGSDPNPAYIRRMEMVRHLPDVVNLDVNAVKHQVGTQCTTPLCFVAR